MTRCKRSLQAVVFGVLAFSTLEARTEEEQSTFKAGVIELTKLFADMRQAIKQSVIKPAERDQALRYLRRLSRDLEVLAVQKDSFAREVQFTKLPASHGQLEPDAQELIRAVKQVQESLLDTFRALPDEFSGAASEVRRKLDLSLNRKLDSLQGIATFAGSSGQSREDIVADVKNDARLARDLREEVDRFRAHIAASPE